MEFAYYPGCTLKTQGKALDKTARACAQHLGFSLVELPQWQCCGGVYPQSTDEIAVRLSSVRALRAARDQGQDLITLCSACHNVIKRVNLDIKNNPEIRDKVNRYLAPAAPYHGETRVIHYLQMLLDYVGFDNLRRQVVRPLVGMQVGAYYGCLLLRPGKDMELDDPENPHILEDFIRALGAEPVYYGQRNECCGGYQTLENPGQATRRATIVADNARESGAEVLVTACPLCQYNLTKNAARPVKVLYFTELLAQALGIEEASE